MTDFDSILKSEVVSEFMLGVENKILERGLLTKHLGISEFVISLSLQKYVQDDIVGLKVVLDIDPDDGELSLSADQCDDIQDMIIDYLNEKGLHEILEECGLEDGSEDIVWVHISVGGKFLYD